MIVPLGIERHALIQILVDAELATVAPPIV